MFVHKSKILLKAYLAVGLFIQGEKCYQIIYIRCASSKLEDLERQLHTQPSMKKPGVIYQKVFSRD